jgi:hypothetical protein
MDRSAIRDRRIAWRAMPDTARQRFNRKREIVDPPPSASDLNALADRVGYGGNPEHKQNPGDFGLIPPSAPRPDKTLCDEVHILSRSAAVAALREGVRRGLISRAMRGAFPQNIWSVTAEGIPLEAQLENRDAGTYHGYPIPENDPFRASVLGAWKHRK